MRAYRKSERSPAQLLNFGAETQNEHHALMSDIMIIGDSNDIFVVVGGVKIAKRGHAGTPEAGTWISLKAGWTVTENDDEIEVARVPVH